MYYVYVIQNEKLEFYTGFSMNLAKRLANHNAGGTPSTNGHKWELVYYEAYVNEHYARKRELALKKNRRMSTFLMKRIKESLSY